MTKRRALSIFVLGAHLFLSSDCCSAFVPLFPTRKVLKNEMVAPVCSRSKEKKENTRHSRLPAAMACFETAAKRGIVGAILGASIIFTPMVSSSQAWAALTENQQFVSDVWFAVTAQYFDPTFNGMTEDGWRAKKSEALAAVKDLGPEDESEVEGAIQKMLASLDDPYTRFLSREKFEALTAYARGGNAGIGVQLLLDPRTKNVVVMRTENGGPAATAGILPGDSILKVDGESMEGATAEFVAAKCRGEAGGKVELLIRRGSMDVANTDKQKSKTERLLITRSIIKVNPIQASTFQSSAGNRIGLIQVPSFSQETPGQMIDALRLVSEDAGVAEIVIDLRGNVGGYMQAGVDCAKLFLPGRAHIIAEVSRGDGIKAYDADGVGANLQTPVYLLVDGRTASAAEIFTCALQDNRRAIVVGTTTFGKGRIQNIQSIGNGSGVSVTRARYITPRGRDLHGVGIQPNIGKEPSQCGPQDTAARCLADIIA